MASTLCVWGSACVGVVTVQYSKKDGRHNALNVQFGLGVVVARGIVYLSHIDNISVIV